MFATPSRSEADLNPADAGPASVPYDPPGWGYNPSTWSQRLPVVGLALVGTGIATYLALYQYEVVDGAWEPFFTAPGESKNPTELVLTSRLSFPFTQLFGWEWMPFRISDAALGAFAYVLDAVAGVWGGKRRWRDLPWMVIVFAILVGPLGAVSIALVIAQPLIEGQWCTLCLTTAVISMVMIPFAMDEALATLQYLKRVKDDPERSVWRAFWGIEQSGKINIWGKP